MQDAQVLVDRAQHWPPISPAFVKLAQALNGDYSLDDISAIVQTDAALTVRVLALANSPAYAARGGITSVDQAVVRIGGSALLRIVTSALGKALVPDHVAGYDASGTQFWTKSLYAACFAEELAERTGLCSPGLAYTTGLLLDIGKLVCATDVAAKAMAFEAEILGSGKGFDAIERELLGLDHAALGAILAQTWRLPEPMVEAIAKHHGPASKDDPPLVTLCQFAEVLALMASGGTGADGLRYTAPEGGLGALDDHVDEVVFAASSRVSRLKELSL